MEAFKRKVEGMMFMEDQEIEDHLNLKYREVVDIKGS